MAGQRMPVAENLFAEIDGEIRLLGACCPACGVIVFPAQRTCPRCGGMDLSTRPLSRQGTLWDFTTQGYLPKAPYQGPSDPETFEPYTVGYVELSDEVIVQSRLTESDPGALRIGMPMELTLIPFIEADDGTEIVTFAFRPVP